MVKFVAATSLTVALLAAAAAADPYAPRSMPAADSYLALREQAESHLGRRLTRFEARDVAYLFQRGLLGKVVHEVKKKAAHHHPHPHDSHGGDSEGQERRELADPYLFYARAGGGGSHSHKSSSQSTQHQSSHKPAQHTSGNREGARVIIDNVAHATHAVATLGLAIHGHHSSQPAAPEVHRRDIVTWFHNLFHPKPHAPEAKEEKKDEKKDTKQEGNKDEKNEEATGPGGQATEAARRSLSAESMTILTRSYYGFGDLD